MASASQADSMEELPLHILCRNSSVQPQMLCTLVGAYPDALYARACDGATPLHVLCANECVTPELVAELLSLDKRNCALSAPDAYGATPIHIISMNEAVTPAHLRALLLMCAGDDALAQDVHDRSPLHYLCMNRSVSPECLWLFFERSSELVRQIDKDGRTPLHHVCCNPSITSVVIEIMFDAWPGAAMIADKEMCLPVQYLVDNPVSVPELSALLISGPSSYRLRYDFLGVTCKCASYTVNSESVCAQTSYAVDSKSAAKVMMRFFSTGAAANHERGVLLQLRQSYTDRVAHGHEDDVTDFSLRIVDEFDDAKRRATLRSFAVAPEDQKGDSPVVLNYAIVTEAPVYSLEGLLDEQLEDAAAANAIVSDVAECLHFWHRAARMVHGNVGLSSFGHFTSPGLKLFNFGTSRALEQPRAVGLRAMDAASCPPEAAKAFLNADAFVPTTASDVWQFGCLVLAPWSKLIGDEQILHLISAVTDSALAVIISEVESPCLRPILQRTLVLNPSHRWDIDRLVNTPGLSVAARDGAAASPAYEFLHSTLQQHTEGLLVAEEHHRAAKHAHDQLDFMRKEQALLRHDLVATRSYLREAEEAEQLQAQLASVTHQREEAKLEVQVFAHNHQSMTQQLHTTVQMLLNLVPLARKVYGAKADEFLSGALSQAAGFETELDAGFPPSPLSRRRMSAVQVVKSRLQNSRFAYGCVSTWANKSGASCNGSFEGVVCESVDGGAEHGDAEEKGDVSEDFDLPRPREKRVESPAHEASRSIGRSLAAVDSERGTIGGDQAAFAPVASSSSVAVAGAARPRPEVLGAVDSAAAAAVATKVEEEGEEAVGTGAVVAMKDAMAGAAVRRGGGGGGRERKPAPPNAGVSLDEAFCMQVNAQLVELVEDGARSELSFPIDLDNTQRRYIHTLAQKYGLFSKSSGKGDSRFIHVAKVKKNARMEQVSLRLAPVPLGRADGAWLPPPITDYLASFPPPPAAAAAALPPNADPWAAIHSRAMASYVQSHERSVGRSQFRPLQPDASKRVPGQPRAPSAAAASLPVAAYRDDILQLVATNQVVVISGDTGCGKSTQIPQFLLDDAVASGAIDQTRIICTQPRRLSAISLAERVARERSSSAATGVHGSGAPDSREVGHAIRFDSSFDAHKSKLIFCTTGTLLKWLNADPLAHGFSHLILDEVHERDQFTDYLLILLKTSILRQRPDLKVILMSATIQVDKFARYFQPEYSAPMLEMAGGRCFPVTTLFLEDALALLSREQTDFSTNAYAADDSAEEDADDGDSAADAGLLCPMCNGGGFADEEAFGLHVAMCFGDVQHTAPAKKPKKEKALKAASPPPDTLRALQRQLSTITDAEKEALLSAYAKQEDALTRDQNVDYDVLLRLLELIDRRFPLDPTDPKGAILVFLPGWEEISYLERALLRNDHTASTFELALLHSRLSAQEQRRASSFVMGLQTTWVAKANCVQRTGRAGRVRPGVCFRLFSRSRYETAMKEFMVPELLTTPLEELLLQIKLLQFENKLHIRDAKAFLLQAMDPPSETAIDASLQRLCDMGALETPDGGPTLFGWHLGHICNGGFSVQMAKLILWGHFLGSHSMVLETTCALSGYRDPFLSFLGMTGDELRRVEAAKQAFLRHTPFPMQSDHFILMQALEAYVDRPSRSYHDLEAFCRQHMLHRQTLEQVFSIFRQSEKELGELGMTHATQLVPAASPGEKLTAYLMALGAGMYPNALFAPVGSASRNWTSREKVKVKMDSSSALTWSGFGGGGGARAASRNAEDESADSAVQLDWIVFHEMMQSERTRVAKYGTKLPSLLVPLLLMGQNELVQVVERPVPPADASDAPLEPATRSWLLVLDEWIVFELQTETEARAVVALRARLQAAFHRHLVRLHALRAELYQQSQAPRQPRGRPHHKPPPLPQSELNDELRAHDEALLRSVVAWVAADLQRK
ncbi:hypothetical protein PybrP1_011147 [[Pythium] brassicae (nom. inval.)]|nr:hypothetical protein PybrP1_011147 [[Pythium] brassicae (nom. inval.)]